MEEGSGDAATDATSTRPTTNGRAPAANRFAVNRDSRKPLFGAAGGKNNKNSSARKKDLPRSATQPKHSTATARPTSSAGSMDESKSDSGMSTTPQGTRIPRPKTAGAAISHPRKPITLMDAYRLAEEEEEKRTSSPAAPDLSPSPAPRPWLSRHESDENKMRRMLNRGPVDFTKGRNRRSSAMSTDSGTSGGGQGRPDSRASQNSASTTGSFERRLNEFEQGIESSAKGKGGLFSKSRIGPKVARAGESLARKASNSSLDGSAKSPSNSLGRSNSKRGSKSGWLKRLVSKDGEQEEAIMEDELPDKDVPIPSVEVAANSQEPTPPTSRPNSEPAQNVPDPSPNKSYAWQVDEEFTAGDLQVSNSPRIHVGSYEESHGKREQNEDAPKPDFRTRQDRPRVPNTKLDDIRARELEVEKEFPVTKEPERRSRPANTKLDEIRALEMEIDEVIPLPDPKERPRNTKLDEIRAREMEVLSKRALASSRLDEIRERNSVSRSRSPEDHLERVLAMERTQYYNAQTSANGGSTFEGEAIPNTPITVYRKSTQERTARHDKLAEDRDQKSSRNSSGSRPTAKSQDDHRDVLRRLSRAASSSPSAEDLAGKEGTMASGTATGRRELDSKREKSKILPNTQRSNNPRKPTPPEIKEPETQRPTVGFVGLRRAQSTESTRTKRSSMHSDSDPTERIEREMQLFAPMENHSEKGSIRAPSPTTSDDDEDDEPAEETPRPKKVADPLTMPTPRVTGAYVETPATVKTETTDFAAPVTAANVLRNKIGVAKKQQDKVDSDPESRPTRTRASGPRRRRAKSLPRRSQPLINTAKPPTVKDDLLELQRTHNIEDSTLDEFGELLAQQKAVSPDTDEDDKAAMVKDESDSDSDPAKSQREKEQVFYDRMARDLQAGVQRIRAATEGIERLEGQVSKADGYIGEQVKTTGDMPTTSTAAVAYILIPIPRLYHRRPFRLTFIGLVLATLFAWYLVETATCSIYCRPETCSTTPCIWSPEDPTFGTALPSKLDDWTTGGRGRRLVARLSEEVDDLVADAWDLATGTDIRDVDPSTLDFNGRRQYRRRLRKKKLAKKRMGTTPEDRAKWKAWRLARKEDQRRRAAREMGYEEEEDAALGSDERI